MNITQTLAATSTASAATGAFHVSNGQIVDPNGNTFVARGIDIGPQDMATVAQSLSTTFPGANFIRLATWDTAPYSLADYENFVSQMAAKGVVVEFEDHAYPSPGTYTGAQLTTESNWYASLASAFANNPYVWFGTMNEPNSGTYGASEAAITTQEVATYNAIRGAGNNSMIMMELDGGGNPGTVGVGFGMTTSAYASMTNIAWDLHYYGWTTGFSTDQSTVTAGLLGSVNGGYGIAAAQTITSADGTVPVIIGEFGDSSYGATADANGSQVINAVLNSGYGYAAWTWGGQGGPDELTQNGSLTSFGQQVAAAIKASSSQGPGPTQSADNTVIKAGSSAAIIDANGNAWSISSGGQVAVNGAADTTTGNVTELAYEKGLVWQENSAKLWWSKSQPSDAWGPSAGIATSPVPVVSPNDTVVTAPSTAAIIDASGNKWTIDSAGQVAVNGVADTTTANVIELAYVNGTIWQQNSAKLWWGETQPNAGWAPQAGTPTSPLPPLASPNDSVVYIGQTSVITDASGDTWSITSAGQVAVNGVADATTANVTELAYVGKTVWQENKSALWWGKTSPAAAWSPDAGTSTSPLPAPISLAAGQASVTVSQSQVSLLATAGNHMVFIKGAGDTINLSGGTDTITDTGHANTYVVPPAGHGYDSFASNILNAGDTLDLRAALAATHWNGSAASLAHYLTVTDTTQGAVLSIAATPGAPVMGIATISGATTATLGSVLAHALT